MSERFPLNKANNEEYKGRTRNIQGRAGRQLQRTNPAAYQRMVEEVKLRERLSYRYVLKEDHIRGNRPPIPAGTIGDFEPKVTELDDHLAISFEGYGTYYCLEADLNRVKKPKDDKEYLGM